jgi:hypothetical protein
MSDTNLLVGLGLFIGSFVAWWYLTLPVYRERARHIAFAKSWRAYVGTLPSAAEYTPELRASGTYTPRPYTGDRFPGSVPSTFSMALAESHLNEDGIHGMPAFAAARGGAALPA